MAGIITHIVIADRIAHILDDRIKDVPLFFSGNIAPDSIHSRENFVRAMKKHTHLRDDIRDADFLKHESQELFHKRLDEFVERYCIKGDKEFDLYCGYLTHLLADELFMKTIRLKFTEEMEKLNIKQSDKEYFRYISFDLDNIDNRLSQEYSFKNNPKDTLWGAKDYEVKDYLTAGELTNSKGWLTWSWFDNKKEYTEPKYISYESILNFIEYASNKITGRLIEYNLY
ncbi:MAG: zinc dependent phospholipase C family protein [Ruminococcus sp.]|nr:zinc dependent phospholipase C family protein [Ruminococcus sp.]